MTLVPVSLALGSDPLPADIEALIADAQARIDAWYERSRDDPIPGFVPSDFPRTYQALKRIRASNLSSGTSFCEWGSGMGAVAVLAARVGFASCGIESEPALVEASRGLAEKYAPGVEFVAGSFVPEGADATVDRNFEFDWLVTGVRPGYDELGLDIDDFDLIFAYPWPGEEDVVFELFDDHAARGALLLTFHGDEGLRLQRKS